MKITPVTIEKPAMTINVSMPENLDDAINEWGDEVCYELLLTCGRQKANGQIRRMAQPTTKKDGTVVEGQSAEAIQAFMDAWKPCERPMKKSADPVDAVKALLASMSEEDRRAFVARQFGVEV